MNAADAARWAPIIKAENIQGEQVRLTNRRLRPVNKTGRISLISARFHDATSECSVPAGAE
jgi:hypothetical protein